jgi:broad specificity phosphatase PhoE
MNKISKKKLRFFLVRHGETADNLQMRYLGIRDEPLTKNGMVQACQAAAALAQLPIDLIFTSPLRRAVDTAIQIQTACDVKLRVDSRLTEGSFGKWEGLTRDEVLELDSREAERLAKWESDASFAPPGGEAFDKVQERIVELADQLKNEFEGSSVVLVSHVGPMKALIAAALKIPLLASSRFFLDPASISVVDWGENSVLRLFNSHAHLGWDSARWMAGRSQ